MKIAIIQCNSHTGNLPGNRDRLLTACSKAAVAGAGLCLAPGLSLCGFAPGKYLQASGFIQGARQVLEEMAADLADGPPTLVGAPVAGISCSDSIAGAAVLLEKGEVRILSHAPFRPGRIGASCRQAESGGAISCGIFQTGGWRIGVVPGDFPALYESQAAEGHGPDHDPIVGLCQRGVDAIVMMTARPFCLGRQDAIEHRLSHIAAQQRIYLFVANLVGGYDESVLAGQSMAFAPTGMMLARGNAFAEDLLIIDTADQATAGQKIVPLCSCGEEAIWKALCLGLGDFVRKTGQERVMLGLSGGLDSSLVAAIAVEALGSQNVTGVLMPSRYTSHESVRDANELANNLGMNTITVPIDGLVSDLHDTLDAYLSVWPAKMGDTTNENIQSRIRGLILSTMANRSNTLVLNTSNKSECAVGYSTLYGDTVGAIGVIADVTKTRVYDVARWYNKSKGKSVIPQNVIDRPPTAELAPNQKDSDSLPVYEELDPMIATIMQARVTDSDSQESIIWSDCVDTETKHIRSMVFGAEFKRRQEPMPIIVTGLPFGTGWQVPVAGRFCLPE